MPPHNIIDIPTNYVPPHLNKENDDYKPGMVKWAVLTLVVIAVMIVVWWALA